MKKRIENRTRVQVHNAHKIDGSDDEHKGETTPIKSQCKARKFSNANTSDRPEKHKKHQALEQACIVDEAC